MSFEDNPGKNNPKETFKLVSMIAKIIPEEILIEMLIKDLQEYQSNPSEDNKPEPLMMLLITKWTSGEKSEEEISKRADEIDMAIKMSKRFTEN